LLEWGDGRDSFADGRHATIADMTLGREVGEPRQAVADCSAAMLPRRRLISAMGTLVAGASCASLRSAGGGDSWLAALERRQGGRLGVWAVDLERERVVAHRADERFPLCSTFKTLLVAACLRQVDLGNERLDSAVPFSEADLLDYAPSVRPNLARGSMTVEELCAGTVITSDNAAANLLLARLRGPAGLTRYLRTLGDSVTRLDRIEPDLNSALPGDVRDTTTPRAMLDCVHRLLLGSALSSTSRSKLLAWHRRCETGTARLLAGLPPGWTLAHKTGTGEHGATNDIGIAFPSDRRPVMLAVYYVESSAPMSAREAVIAEVARRFCAD
jgi:beta-lactamase class A